MSRRFCRLKQRRGSRVVVVPRQIAVGQGGYRRDGCIAPVTRTTAALSRGKLCFLAGSPCELSRAADAGAGCVGSCTVGYIQLMVVVSMV